jgi:hypothetical protein
MGNVNHDNASEAGHGTKISERIGPEERRSRNFAWKLIAFPHREKTMVPVPSVPAFPAPRLSPNSRISIFHVSVFGSTPRDIS